MEWDKIWSFNKKIIDPIAPRHFAVTKDQLIPVNVSDATESTAEAPFHPKNQEVGQKEIFYSKKVFVESADAETFAANDNVTFINWGNLSITKINKKNGKVVSVDAKLNLDNKDFKKTTKVTWLAEHPTCKWTPAVAVEFDNIITKPILDKDDDFKNFINRDSRKSEQLWGDHQLKDCKEGDIIQLQRRGYFRVDQPYLPADGATFQESPAILFAIPDGHTKEMPKTGSKHKEAAKEPKISKKQQKKAEKAAAAPVAPAASNKTGDALKLWDEVTGFGNEVRKLKSAKAPKDQVTAAVQKLLDGKKKFKEVTGQDYDANKKPAGETAPATQAKTAGGADLKLWEEVTAAGDKVRQLKSAKAFKEFFSKFKASLHIICNIYINELIFFCPVYIILPNLNFLKKLNRMKSLLPLIICWMAKNGTKLRLVRIMMRKRSPRARQALHQLRPHHQPILAH